MTEKSSNLLIVGLGLLGGSLGFSLASGPYRRLGWARKAADRALAVERGAVDETDSSLDALLARADLTVLALPVPVIEAFLSSCAERFRRGSIVTDIGSTKGSICETAKGLPGGVFFVGSHPMAGTEKTGLANAFAGLYRNADAFVVPGSAPRAAVETVTAMWREVGCHVREIDALSHDRLVARTSHVLHLVSSALARTVLDGKTDAERALCFAGCATGFRDTSRIASSSPAMWREIIKNNRDEVLRAMREFDVCWEDYRSAVEREDWDQFERLFERGRVLRDDWVAYKEREK